MNIKVDKLFPTHIYQTKLMCTIYRENCLPLIIDQGKREIILPKKYFFG